MEGGCRSGSCSRRPSKRGHTRAHARTVLGVLGITHLGKRGERQVKANPCGGRGGRGAATEGGGQDIRQRQSHAAPCGTGAKNKCGRAPFTPSRPRAHSPGPEIARDVHVGDFTEALELPTDLTDPARGASAQLSRKMTERSAHLASNGKLRTCRLIPFRPERDMF